MQKLILIGHLGNDATLHQLPNKQVINFNLCHTDKWRDATGMVKEKSQWFYCSYFTDKTGILPYLKKGGQVYVEGQIDAKTFTKDNGEVIVQLTCRVNMIQLLGGNKETQPERTLKQETEKSHYSAVEMKSDIPQNDENLPF